jgi:hypothetical protein
VSRAGRVPRECEPDGERHRVDLGALGVQLVDDRRAAAAHVDDAFDLLQDAGVEQPDERRARRDLCGVAIGRAGVEIDVDAQFGKTPLQLGAGDDLVGVHALGVLVDRHRGAGLAGARQLAVDGHLRGEIAGERRRRPRRLASLRRRPTHEGVGGDEHGELRAGQPAGELEWAGDDAGQSATTLAPGAPLRSGAWKPARRAPGSEPEAIRRRR